MKGLEDPNSAGAANPFQGLSGLQGFRGIKGLGFRGSGFTFWWIHDGLDQEPEAKP